MADKLAFDGLSAELEHALTLLEAYRRADGRDMPAEPLPSLLEQCQVLCSKIEPPNTIRSLHHFACSGGTLISKCVAALPNVISLSEMDPLSTMQIIPVGQKPHFAPTDLIRALRHTTRKVDDDILVKTFVAGLAAAHTQLSHNGYFVLIRDHAHSQFCTNEAPDDRMTLYEILKTAFPVRSVVTVRHPMDSFLSITANRWLHFTPPTLEEYSRRYLKFLNRHSDLPVISYEAFVAAPAAVLEELSELLALPFNPMALEVLSAIRMTGDSGRSSARIASRPRREIAATLQQEPAESPSYAELCARLSYET